MIEPFGQPLMPLRDIVFAEHFGNLPPLYFEPFGNITVARWTTGFSTSPGVSQWTSILSLTPRGFFLVPGLSGVTLASAVTVVTGGSCAPDGAATTATPPTAMPSAATASFFMLPPSKRLPGPTLQTKPYSNRRIRRRGSHRVRLR